MSGKWVWNRDAGINLFILSFLFSLGIMTGIFLQADLMFYLSILGGGLVLVVIGQEGWWRLAWKVLLMGFLVAGLRFGWMMFSEVKVLDDTLEAQILEGRVVSMVEEMGLEKSFLLESKLGKVKVKLFSERKIAFDDIVEIQADLMGNAAEINLNWKGRL
ncbi:hypothetical protein IT411_02475, partial [Candidatus Peregrinibacteria bacterium]|nr:hypothetical protein [Candidatus Peregrinibacteria bacterium]